MEGEEGGERERENKRQGKEWRAEEKGGGKGEKGQTRHNNRTLLPMPPSSDPSQEGMKQRWG